jgi:hypothetical protein
MGRTSLGPFINRCSRTGAGWKGLAGYVIRREVELETRHLDLPKLVLFRLCREAALFAMVSLDLVLILVFL